MFRTGGRNFRRTTNDGCDVRSHTLRPAPSEVGCQYRTCSVDATEPVLPGEKLQTNLLLTRRQHDHRMGRDRTEPARSIVTPAKLFDSPLSVEQYLDLAGLPFGAETSQLTGFSARPLAGLSSAGFPTKVARLRMLREVMRWCSSFLYPLLPCLVWHSFQF
jgi:hypothetical protein